MVSVEKLVYQGYGLARQDGKTVFVRRGAPGDHAEIRIVERRKNFDIAEIERLIEPSVARVDAPCIFFHRGCGGCQWQHLSYQQQLEWKRAIFLEFLERSQFSGPYPEILAHPSEPFHYRTRFQFHLSENRQPALFREHTHNLVPVDYCWLLPEPLNLLLKQLAKREWLNGVKWFQLWIDDSDRTGLQTTPELTETSCLQARADLPGVLLLSPTSQDRMEYQVGGLRFLIGGRSFFQTNRFLNTELSKKICDIAGEGRRLLDLYSGVGFFTLPVSRQYERVTGIDESAAAVGEAAAVSALNNITNAEFFAGSVERWIESSRESFDTVIADPPRAGLSRRIVEGILRMAPSRVIYVSCDPATLVRDILWLGAAYSVKQFHIFDLFPQTFHFEVVAELWANRQARKERQASNGSKSA